MSFKNVRNSSGFTQLEFWSTAGSTGPAGGVADSWFTAGNSTGAGKFLGTKLRDWRSVNYLILKFAQQKKE